MMRPLEVAMHTTVGPRCGIADYTRALTAALVPRARVTTVPITEGRWSPLAMATAGRRLRGDVALNVGTGSSTSVAALAEAIARSMGVALAPEIVGRFREGDIRHCVADVSRIRRALGFSARMGLAKGVEDLVTWARQQRADDHVAQARDELERKGLIR